MSFSRASLSAAFVLVLSIVALAGAVESQGYPASLTFPLGPLFLKTDGKLANGTGGAAGTVCAGMDFSGQGAVSQGEKDKTFTYDVAFTPAEPVHFHLREAVTVTLHFIPTQQSSPMGTTGFTVTGELTAGGVSSPLTATASQDAGTVTDKTLSFAVNETNFQAHTGGPLSLKIKIAPKPPNPALPQWPASANNYALECGPSTKTSDVTLYRGMPGDGDLDGDAIPDAQDQDRDGDNATNAQENTAFTTPVGARGAVKCQEMVPSAADDPRIRPGDKTSADFDKDGWSDQEECSQGFDPLSASSTPPRPRTLMDILLPIIIILIILAVLAALVFLFLKFGKTVSVTVLSTPELFVPAGTKGKYELAVQNLSKKGEPRTYQLAASGLPEGWDAKLNVDHVTLDPQGGANNQGRVWLEVESPVHQDPESAVVTVKAVPLNKAGRKDTLKVPGRATTITSINVPAGSKVPVKRGGKIAAAQPKDEEAAPPGPTGDQAPVIAVEGIGETYGPKLNKAGIMTVGDLLRADPAMVAKKTGAPPATVASWQQMCELMQLDGVGPQFSEQLVRTGITSIAQLAEQKPKELVAQIEKTNAAREVPIQGAGIQDKQAKNFVKAAERWMKDHPAGAPPAVAATSASAAAPTPAAASAAPPAAKPQLQVGGLKHEPPAFRQGESVKSSVSVSNNGKDKSTIKLSLYVNDGLADVQTVTVKPGKAQDVQFKWTAQEKNKLNIRGELVSQ